MERGPRDHGISPGERARRRVCVCVCLCVCVHVCMCVRVCTCVCVSIIWCSGMCSDFQSEVADLIPDDYVHTRVSSLSQTPPDFSFILLDCYQQSVYAGVCGVRPHVFISMFLVTRTHTIQESGRKKEEKNCAALTVHVGTSTLMHMYIMWPGLRET